MIKFLVEVSDFFIGKGSDRIRITTIAVIVNRILDGILRRCLGEQILRCLVNSLHLIENDTFVLQLPRFFGEIVSPSFLHKITFAEKRAKGVCKIDFHEIFKVLSVLGTERIAGEIRTSPSIHVSVQRSLDHLEERIADRILLTF